MAVTAQAQSTQAPLPRDGLFQLSPEPLQTKISPLHISREDVSVVYERHPDVSQPGFDFGFFHRLATFSDPVPAREIDALLKRYANQILDPARLRATIAAMYARQGKSLDPRTQVTMPKLVDGLRALLVDREAFRIWEAFLSRGGTLDFGYGRFTPKPLRITATPEDTYTTDGNGKSVPGDVIDTQSVLLHEALHFAFDLADTRISELGGASDHEAIHVIEERIEIVQLMRSGRSPVDPSRSRAASLAHARQGILGALSGNDAEALLAIVEDPGFFGQAFESGADDFHQALARSTGGQGYAFSDGEVRDIERGFAFNAAIAQQGLRLAAVVSKGLRKKLEKSFGTSEFQERFGTFCRNLGQALDADFAAPIDMTARNLMDAQIATLRVKR